MATKKIDVVEKIKEEAVEVAEEIAEEVKESVETVKKVVKKEAKALGIAKPRKKSAKEDEEEKNDKDGKKAKFKELLEKAKKLEKGLEEEEKKAEKIDLKEKVREEQKKDMLVPIEDYLKASIHLGTRVITPNMRPYVYRRRADGLAVFNTALLDDKIREGAEFLSQFAPENILLVCKREAGWLAVKKFSEITGVRVFTKKYPAGVLTNPNLENFIEADLVFICDPWLDKNALQDANRVKIPVLSVCDTNNFTKGIDKIIPGNNKSYKSLGIIFYLLAKIYTEKHKIKTPVPDISQWIEGWDTLVPPK